MNQNTTEQTLSRIEAMISQETTAYVVHDYLLHLDSYVSTTTSATTTSRRNRRERASILSLETPPVDTCCRFLMAQWCNTLCDFCNYDRDLTASAMSCVDRFAATKEGFDILMDRDRYQLAVMSSLYLMAKIQQIEALDPASMAKLSRGKHTKVDIEEMELELLIGLRWRVHPPTPWTFAQELLNLIPSYSIDKATRKELFELTKLQLEVATCDYELSLKRPSSVAFGAVLNAMESIMDTDFALEFENMVFKILKSDLDEVRDTRLLLLKGISDEPRGEPMCAILKQRMLYTTIATPTKQKFTSFSSSVNASPRSVSAGMQDSLKII